MVYDTLIRSRRRTLSIEIVKQGQVIVRAPRWMPQGEILSFVLRKTPWIERHKQRLQNRPLFELTVEQTSRLKKKALEELPERLGTLSRVTGLSFDRIKVTSARYRWGSCRGRNICLSWRLMIHPWPVIDYVLIHELVHVHIKNHSRRFWEKVAKHCPDYKQHRRTLRESAVV